MTYMTVNHSQLTPDSVKWSTLDWCQLVGIFVTLHQTLRWQIRDRSMSRCCIRDSTYACKIKQEIYSYHKQIARQHFWSTLYSFPHILFDDHANFGCRLSYSMCTCRRSQKFWERWGSPFGMGACMDDTLEARYSPIRVIISYFVVLGQTVWA